MVAAIEPLGIFDLSYWVFFTSKNILVSEKLMSFEQLLWRVLKLSIGDNPFLSSVSVSIGKPTNFLKIRI